MSPFIRSRQQSSCTACQTYAKAWMILATMLLIGSSQNSPLQAHEQLREHHGEEAPSHSLRFYKSAPGKPTLDPPPHASPEEMQKWLEQFQSSTENGTPVSRVAPLTSDELEPYFREKIRSYLKVKEIQIVKQSQSTRQNGRHFFEFTFALEGMPIPGYHIKAHQIASGDIIIIGEIPQGHFERPYFDHHKVSSHISTDTQIEWIKEELASQHPAWNLQSLQLVQSSQCILTVENYFVPGTCLALRYEQRFIEARLTKKNLQSIIYHGAHFCGLLLDIHTYNTENTDKKDFAVDLCNDYPDRNVLANERFIFEGLNTCNNIPELPPRDQLTKNVIPPENEDPSSSLTKKSGTFQYSRIDTLGFRMVHAFSHLNRMMDWFESHGFKGNERSVLRIFFTNTDKRAASYTGLWLQAQAFPQYHFITYGLSAPRGVTNPATDFDVSAHELGHYVISHAIPPFNPQKSAPSEDYIPLAIHEGLADYFTYAATEDDCLGESTCSKSNRTCSPLPASGNCLRNAEPLLADGKTPSFVYGDDDIYRKLQTISDGKPAYHILGQLVSGFLWRSRRQLSSAAQRRKFDHMVLGALEFAPHAKIKYQDIVAAVLYSDKALDESQPFCQTLLRSAEVYFAKLNLRHQTPIKGLLAPHCTASSSSSFLYESHSLSIADPSPPRAPDIIRSPKRENYSIAQAQGLACMENPEEMSDLASVSGIDVTSEQTSAFDAVPLRDAGDFGGCQNIDIGCSLVAATYHSEAPHRPPFKVHELFYLLGFLFPLLILRRSKKLEHSPAENPSAPSHRYHP